MLTIQTLDALTSTHPTAHLVLIGPLSNPQYRKELEREVYRRGLQYRVTIIPGLPAGSQDLVDAYHASDVFLLPSIHEPFGIVILEAWAADLPVVASAVGGVPSFVTDGVSGLLVPTQALEAMVASTKLILDNPFARDTLARGGRLKANRSFSWSQVTGQLTDIYQTVIREHAETSGAGDALGKEVA
jgi:glycosyltransferase involved in cell wall biosynthesis